MRTKNKSIIFYPTIIDGLVSIWRATGEDKYLDTVLSLIDNTLNDAVSVGGGYLGWPAANGLEYALWDSFYWRHVITLARIMHQSPNLRARKNYQQKYDQLLAFSEKHIWERYYKGGTGNLYRSRTHMASHWARIGMELYIMTGKSQYKDVFENISYKGMPNRGGASLKEQIFSSSKISGAILWDSEWSVKEGSSIQDTSHAGAIISFWVTAHENNMYWDQSHINALMKTWDKSVWPASGNAAYYEYVNSTGKHEARGRMHEWLSLGRYSSSLQKRIKDHYSTNATNVNYYGTQVYGIAALNARILSDGKGIYPEN